MRPDEEIDNLCSLRSFSGCAYRRKQWGRLSVTEFSSVNRLVSLFPLQPESLEESPLLGDLLDREVTIILAVQIRCLLVELRQH